MMDTSRARAFCKVAPMVMSLIALAIVIEGVIEFGSHPPADEGWQAHLFQILMVTELPIMLAFLVMSWHSLKRNLPTLATQLALWAVAIGAVRFFSL